MPTASELLGQMMRVWVSESDVRTSCPECGEAQTLNQATLIFSDPMRPTYLCGNGCSPILIVGLAIDGIVPHRGHEAGAYLLRNPCDMYVEVAGEQEVRFPARRNALD